MRYFDALSNEGYENTINFSDLYTLKENIYFWFYYRISKIKIGETIRNINYEKAI